MNERGLIETVLGSDRPDSGCDRGMEILDVYVEAEVAGRPVADLFPDVAGHLEACADCREDHAALLELVRRPLDPS
jgi:hypothetical protein